MMQNGLSALAPQTQIALAVQGITSRDQLASTAREALKRLPGIGPRRLSEIDRLLGGESLLDAHAEHAIAAVLRRHIEAPDATACAARVLARLKDLGFSWGSPVQRHPAAGRVPVAARPAIA